MTKKLTPFMEKALMSIIANGGLAVPTQGGYWYGENGDRLRVEPEPNSVQDTVSTNTIYALEARGKLRRLNRDPRPYRDTYEVVL